MSVRRAFRIGTRGFNPAGCFRKAIVIRNQNPVIAEPVGKDDNIFINITLAAEKII